MDRAKRHVMFHIRATHEEREAWRAAARAAGLKSTSGWIRRLASAAVAAGPEAGGGQARGAAE